MQLIKWSTQLRSQFKHSFIVFHQGTPNTQRQQKPRGYFLGFHYFLVFGTPDEILKLVFELLPEQPVVYLVFPECKRLSSFPRRFPVHVKGY